MGAGLGELSVDRSQQVRVDLVLGVEDAHDLEAALGQRGVQRLGLALGPGVIDDPLTVAQTSVVGRWFQTCPVELVSSAAFCFTVVMTVTRCWTSCTGSQPELEMPCSTNAFLRSPRLQWASSFAHTQVNI